jgi:DNA-binding GntR family transcriptional regulator
MAEALLATPPEKRPRMPLERVSTAQQVADSLREQMLRGEFPPGSRIPEEDIAADLQVSRNSVREGLQILVSEGLVQRTLHRGAVVSDLDQEQLADVYQARRVIEIASLRSGMGQTDTWLGAVLDALRDMEAAVASGELSSLLDADRRFHEGIVAGSKSQRIRRFYRNLQTEIRLTRTWRGEREPSPVFFARHKEVVEAIQARDARLAERLLRRIIDDGEARVRTSLEGSEST